MEEEVSRSSAGEDDDFDDTQDDGEDFEATIDEEELLDDGDDYADELKDLEDESEMPIEELRRRYGMADASSSAAPTQGSTTPDNEDAKEDEDESDFLDYLKENGGNEDDDIDYAPPKAFQGQVRIDPIACQAEVPQYLPGKEINAEKQESTDDSILLWSHVNNKLSNAELNQFLSDVVDIRTAHEQGLPERSSRFRDDEDALCALLRSNYDVKKAKESFPFPRVNAPLKSVRNDALAWDDEERRAFVSAIEQCGKDFARIQRIKFPYRKVGEVVEHYYQWKTTSEYRFWRAAHPRHTRVLPCTISYRQTAAALFPHSPSSHSTSIHN